MYVHKEKGLKTLVHGDDYFSCGTMSALQWLNARLMEKYQIKTEFIGKGEGMVEEGKILNRVVRWTPQGYEAEADPRHCEIILEQLNLVGCKSLSTPGSDQLEDFDPTAVEETLPDDQVTMYRAISARCNYLALDRPDICYPTKEACREMSAPSARSWDRRVRIGKYLRGRPRLIWRFDLQDEPDCFDVCVDANWAGCRRSRKSTSGGTLMRGRHGLKAWSKTQATIAKSSGESELFGAVRGAVEALGAQTLAADFGDVVRARMHMDATAAMGIINRRGLSKIRHLDTDVLWLQEQECKRLLPTEKIHGNLNPADLLTKNLSFDKILQYTKSMCLEFRSGRSEVAAKLHWLGEDSSADRGVDRGDTWDSRGAWGKWTRRHTTWRSRLFTPFRVAKGPGKNIDLDAIRVTRGRYADGERFELRDRWQDPGNEHRDLKKQWIGTTTFMVEGFENPAARIPEVGRGHSCDEDGGRRPAKARGAEGAGGCELHLHDRQGRGIWDEMLKFVDRWADACDDVSEGAVICKKLKSADDEGRATSSTLRSAGSCDAKGAAVSCLEQ